MIRIELNSTKQTLCLTITNNQEYICSYIVPLLILISPLPSIRHGTNVNTTKSWSYTKSNPEFRGKISNAAFHSVSPIRVYLNGYSFSSCKNISLEYSYSAPPLFSTLFFVSLRETSTQFRSPRFTHHPEEARLPWPKSRICRVCTIWTCINSQQDLKSRTHTSL